MKTRTTVHQRKLGARIIALVGAVAVATVLTPAIAHADGVTPMACPPDSYYFNITSLGNDHVGVGPNLYVRNENPTPVNASFISEVTGSVSVTASWAGTISGGVDFAVVNAGVSNTFGISTTYTLTAKAGITAGPMTVPANKIQWASYGVNIRKTQGTFGREYSNCSYASVTITLAKSPTGIGWKLWQTGL